MARLKRLLCDLVLITQCVLTEGINPAISHVFAEPGNKATIPCDITFSGQCQWYKEDEAGQIASAYIGSCDKNTSERLYMTCSPNVTLVIKNVNREDAGTYYCTISNMNPIFHSARTLVITGPRDPSLSILVPMGPSSTAMLLCVASGWSHSWTPVKWSLPEAEFTAQSNVDIDGTFRSLIIIPGKNKTDDMSITCSIEKRSTGKAIKVSQEPVGDRVTPRSEDCWIVLYVGIPVIVLILLVHQIILCRRRQTVSKGHTRPARKPRATNENETVVYSAVKSRENLSPQS